MPQLVLVDEDDSGTFYEMRDDDGVTVLHRQFQPKLGPEETIAVSLRSKAHAAIAANNTFLALAAPSLAQQGTQIKLLTRECNALIRLLINQLDADDA